jgi:hypothetical protein
LPQIARESWHLDKKVPLAFILAILAQTVVAIWYGGKMDHRIEVTEQKIVDLVASNRSQDIRVDLIEADRRIEVQRLTRVEQSLVDIKETMSRVESKLDKLNDRR